MLVVENSIDQESEIIIEYPEDQNEPPLTFLIIGAGMAGLAAAAELLEQGVSPEDILILEAKERIGGRVMTGDKKRCGERLDVGAAWLHGTVDNPLVDILNSTSRNSLNVVSNVNPWMHSDAITVSLMIDGKLQSETERQIMTAKWKELMATISSSCSTATYVELIKQYMNCHPQEYSPSEMSFFLTNLTLLETWTGGSVREMDTSLMAVEKSAAPSLYGDYAGNHCLFNNGTDSLIEAICLAAPVDLRSRVRVNCPVEAITLCSDSGELVAGGDNKGLVTVQLCSGEVLRACHVCVTVPVGPLKQIQFTPALSEQRVTALGRISSGSYKKVQLEWNVKDVFWPTESPFVIMQNRSINPVEYFLGSKTVADEEEEVGEGEAASHELVAKMLGPFVLFDNFMKLRNMPVLEAICPADQGWLLAGRSDSEVVEIIMSVIRQHFPCASYPEGVFVSRWEEDVYSQGAYSHHTNITQHDDVHTIAANIDSKVFFAGEHTDPVLYGSLNAAFNSGKRVAVEMLNRF